LLAFLVALSTTPIAKKLAFKVGAIDIPKDERRMHNKPIARLGGLAIISGFLISVLFTVARKPGVFAFNRDLLGLFAGILIIVAMGLLDDIKQVRARVKLLFQLLAAVVFVVISGTRIERITNPFSASGFTELSVYISYPLTILWIVGITNAINLIDGLDGLAAGVSSISSLSLFIISVLRTDVDAYTAAYTAMLTASLSGSTLGFLPYNFNPAKIFMAETGSAFLGFTLGAVSIQGTLKSYAKISIAIPLLVLGLPLFDTVFAILRRLLSGKPIMQADRGHLHHRLIDMGLSQKQSVAVLYMASSVLGLCAILLAKIRSVSAIIFPVAVSLFLIGGAKYMSEMRNDNGSETVSNTENSAEMLEKKVDGEAESKI